MTRKPCKEFQGLLGRRLVDMDSEDELRSHVLKCADCKEDSKNFKPVPLANGECEDCGGPRHPVSDLHGEGCKERLQSVLYGLCRAAGDFRVCYATYCVANNVNNPKMAEMSNALAAAMQKIPVEWMGRMAQKR